MAKVEGNKIILSKEEVQILKESTNLEIIPNKKGIFLLIDKNNNPDNEIQNKNNPSISNEQKEKLINKIKSKKLTDLVEGKFEDTLSKKEIETLKLLLEEKKIIIFKLNETYKKGVYKINENESNNRKIFDSEIFSVEKKPLPDYELEKDGFVATANLERARILSAEHKERIEEGELRGIKSFEGTYYLIQNQLLEDYSNKLIKIFNENEKINLIDLAQKLNTSIELTKIVCEFLKEDGEILEKKKGEYTYIN